VCYKLIVPPPPFSQFPLYLAYRKSGPRGLMLRQDVWGLGQGFAGQHGVSLHLASCRTREAQKTATTQQVRERKETGEGEGEGEVTDRRVSSYA
jgi:hypothetical protein